MKIVILDGYTLNPGDLSWKEYEKLGDLTVFDRTSPEEVVDRSQNADMLLISKVPLRRETLLALPQLKYIGVLATGYNVVDVKTATERGIIVTNVSGYTGKSAAQMVFALLLELTNRVAHHSQAVFQNRWSESKDFCFWDYPLVELDGQTIGIIGFGGIGKAVAKIATAFGLKILASTRSIPEVQPKEMTLCDMETVFKNSDIVTLHCPLTPETKGLVNMDRLKEMRSSSYLINIARGELIEEEDLANALNRGIIAGAALDVLKTEPADPDCPLLRAKNCYITPHIAWATKASRERLLTGALLNIQSYLAGKAVNTVNER